MPDFLSTLALKCSFLLANQSPQVSWTFSYVLPNQAHTKKQWNTVSQVSLFYSSLSFLIYLLCSNPHKSICPVLPTRHQLWPFKCCTIKLTHIGTSLLFFPRYLLKVSAIKPSPCHTSFTFIKLKCCNVFIDKPLILVSNQEKNKIK